MESDRMNKIVEKAMEIMEEPYNGYIPDVEIGEECELDDIWDGNGECPDESYSYQLRSSTWINYEFEIVEKKKNELETLIRITNIDLL